MVGIDEFYVSAIKTCASESNIDTGLDKATLCEYVGSNFTATHTVGEQHY